MKIFAIGWEIWFGRQFRRYREFISLNFHMLLFCYCCVIVHADYTRIMFLQRSLQRSCVTLIPNRLKDDDSRNRMGGSVWSTIQKVQRIHEIGFLYAYFLLSLRYHFCGLYTDMLLHWSLQRSYVTLILWLCFYFMLWCCDVSQYILWFLGKHCHLTAILSH